MVPVLAACVVMLLAGYLLKGQCLAGWGGREYTNLCYNDIQALYGERHLDSKTFPYVDGYMDADGGLQAGAIEYPVLTGLFMWVTALPVDDYIQYLRISALALAPFALVAAYLLQRQTGWRALMWAAAPALALYSFHNWDLVAAAISVGGFYAWWRGRSIAAAILFAVGAALKLYPAVFVLPLMFDVALMKRESGAPPERQWDPIAAVQIGAIAAGTWLAVNLPFMLVNFEGWSATYRFHEQRTSNYDSIWTVGWPQWGPDRLNLVTTGGTLLMTALIVGLAWWRYNKTGVYPFLQTSGALLAGVMVWGKVQSPQYTLWILPFFALLRVGIGWWAAYSIADLMVYVGIFKWFADPVDNGYKTLWTTGVWARAALLLALIVVFLFSEKAEPEGEAHAELSHPPPTLQPIGDRLTAQG